MKSSSCTDLFLLAGAAAYWKWRKQGSFLQSRVRAKSQWKQNGGLRVSSLHISKGILTAWWTNTSLELWAMPGTHKTWAQSTRVRLSSRSTVSWVLSFCLEADETCCVFSHIPMQPCLQIVWNYVQTKQQNHWDIHSKSLFAGLLLKLCMGPLEGPGPHFPAKSLHRSQVHWVHYGLICCLCKELFV